jgi:hypothetical protein
MLTPIQRRRAGQNFTHALRLVMEAVDAAIAARTTSASVDESRVKQQVAKAVAQIPPAPGRTRRVLELAQGIADKLSPVDMCLLGTGIGLRQRSLLLETLEYRLRNAAVRQAIDMQIIETQAAMEVPNLETPDWPDFLRLLAALLLIVAEIWDMFI